MKWSTANIKNPNYTENHELYVGTHTGSFKKITISDERPFAQENLQDINQLNKDTRITALGFGNADKTEVLVGRSNKFVQVYSLETCTPSTNLMMMDTPVVGLCRFDSHIVAGFGTGKIQKIQISGDMVLTAGDHMSHLRQCEVEPKLVATGGKDRQNNLKIFDLEAGKQIFSSKNLPNDFLQLEVPIWDSDVGFIDANTIATCSRYGYVRLYDTRTQRRPVQKYATEDQMSFTSLTARGNHIYTGTTMGAMKAFDTRRMKNFVHTYKGFTGSISEVQLDDSGKFLVSACLDRYVRIHHVDSCVLMYQCYVKSKATTVLIRNGVGKGTTEDDDCVLVGVDNEDDDEVDNTQQTNEKDEEYDEIFDNMQTICENDDETEGPKAVAKRKMSVNPEKYKKKKKVNKEP